MDKFKEKYNQIIDEVYNSYVQHTVLGVNNGFDRIQGHLDNCLVEYDGYYEYFTNPSFQYGFRPHTQEEFINKCKTDTEFSEKWGLKIEERELSAIERMEYYGRQYMKEDEIMSVDELLKVDYEGLGIPTKLITVTYKENKIEVYE